MSVQAIKGVEVGLGCDAANKFGSEVHDEIFYEKALRRISCKQAGLKGSRIMLGE